MQPCAPCAPGRRSSGTLEFAGRSAGETFEQARPGAFAGACIAYDYRLGGRYLLFLGKRPSAGWRVQGPPFTRVNEEVDGRDSSLEP